MTGVPTTKTAHALARFERLLFASSGDEPRRRRAVDAVGFAAGVVTAWLASVVARGPRTGEAVVVDGLRTVLGWLDPFWSACYGAMTLVSLGVIILAIVSGRHALERDLAAAAGLTIATCVLLTRALDGVWPVLADVAWREGNPTYPSMRLAIAVALFVVATPDLARPARRLTAAVATLGGFGAVVLGAALPADVIGGLAIGLAAGSGVRLIFGSAAGFPSEARVEAGLADLGISVTSLERAPTQNAGVASYVARQADRTFSVKMYGRDARDTQLVARLWRLLWYRETDVHLSFTRLQLVEHEALMLFAAARQGVSVPPVIAVGTASSGDVLLVTERSGVTPLAEVPADDLTAPLLASVIEQAAHLRRAGIGHGRLNAATIVIADGAPLVTDFQGAQFSPSPARLGSDLAELVVSVAILAGNEPTISAAIAALGKSAVADAVPYLQKAALTPGLRNIAQHSHFDLKAFRNAMAEATETTVADIPELRRVSPRRILLTVLCGVAAYTLISMITEIGLRQIVDLLLDAKVVWLVAAFLLAQTALVTDALCMQAAVRIAIPLGPTTLLQSAIKFVNLSTPSSVGKVALNIRYLQRLGVDAPGTVAQGALDGVTGFVVQALLLLILLPMVDLHLDTNGDSDRSTLLVIGVLIIVGAVLTVVIGAMLPSVRRRVMPYLSSGYTSLETVLRSPRRIAKLLVSNFGSQLLFSLCLGASVRAFGEQVAIPQLLLVNTCVSLFSGLMPVPGGVGVAEAALTAGLIAVGLPSDIAFAAAIIHRLASYYLPPIPGAFSLRWLGTHGYV